jgi:hypothetical protein
MKNTVFESKRLLYHSNLMLTIKPDLLIMSTFDLAKAVALSSAAITDEAAKKRKASALGENVDVNEPKVAHVEPAPAVIKPSQAPAAAIKPPQAPAAAAVVQAPVVRAKVPRCFYCGQCNPSSNHHDVLMCSNCQTELFTGYFNREKVMKFYGFSKAKADKIPRKMLRSNRNVFYSYKKGTVEKAFRAEHSQTKISLAVLGKSGKYFK